MCNLNFVTEH
jgi:hypothetical protein